MDKFKRVNLKDPSESFLTWLGQVILPKSSYLNKKTRGKKLLECSIDETEYIAFICKSCNPLLRKQAMYLHFIQLYKEIDKEEIDEEEYDALVKEYIGDIE